MCQIKLTDGSGRCFDHEQAVRFEEKTVWDGHTNFSGATGSPWEHESLYHAASDQWILHHWSIQQGKLNFWRTISGEEAAKWLSRNGCDTRLDDF